MNEYFIGGFEKVAVPSLASIIKRLSRSAPSAVRRVVTNAPTPNWTPAMKRIIADKGFQGLKEVATKTAATLGLVPVMPGEYETLKRKQKGARMLPNTLAGIAGAIGGGALGRHVGGKFGDTAKLVGLGAGALAGGLGSRFGADKLQSKKHTAERTDMVMRRVSHLMNLDKAKNLDKIIKGEASLTPEERTMKSGKAEKRLGYGDTYQPRFGYYRR